jgi:hypothetical protein
MINPQNQATDDLFSNKMQYTSKNTAQQNLNKVLQNPTPINEPLSSPYNMVQATVSNQQNNTSGPTPSIVQQNNKKQPCAKNQTSPISNNSVQQNISNQHNYTTSRPNSNMSKNQPCTQNQQNLIPANQQILANTKQGYPQSQQTFNNNGQNLYNQNQPNQTDYPVQSQSYAQPIGNNAKKPPCRQNQQQNTNMQTGQQFYPQNQQLPYQNQAQQFNNTYNQQQGLPQTNNNSQQDPSYNFNQQQQQIPYYQQNQSFAQNNINNQQSGFNNAIPQILPQQNGQFNNQGQFNNTGEQTENSKECPNSEMENELLNAENPLE